MTDLNDSREEPQSSQPLSSSSNAFSGLQKDLSIAKQLETAIPPDSRSAQLQDLPKLYRGPCTFVLTDWLHQSSNKKSWVYSHGFNLTLAKPYQDLAMAPASSFVIYAIPKAYLSLA